MDGRYFLIGTDGRHYGPLSSDEVETWLTDGRASRHSRARRDGESQWKPLRDMPEFEHATRPPMLGGASALAPNPDSSSSDGRTLERLDPVSCFQRGWGLLTRDFAVLASWTLLVSIIVGVLGMVPRAGLVLAFVSDQLLRSALFLLYLARLRGTPTSPSRIAGIVGASAGTILLAGAAQIALTGLGLLLLIVPGIYLLVGYAFVLPLIVDKRLSAWEALELSRRTVHHHWWSVFGLLLAQAMLILIGALAAGIGVILALPLCAAAMMVAYEDLFGSR
ncbi:MAG: GYF domain-containing protein [Vicinamibacterales bacterium]